MDWDKYAHQYKVLKERVVHYADAAEIGRRLFILPGEVNLVAVINATSSIRCIAVPPNSVS